MPRPCTVVKVPSANAARKIIIVSTLFPDRISIEIPGVSDANQILLDLGKPGALEFLDEDNYEKFTAGNAAPQVSVEVHRFGLSVQAVLLPHHPTYR